jgi:hypothetical protein
LRLDTDPAALASLARPLGAVIAQAVGWQCCDDALIFSLLLEYQLSQMGIGEWPVGLTDYQRVLNSRLRLSDVGIRMRGLSPEGVTDEQKQEMRTAIDFLVNAVPGVSAAQMQRALDGSRNFNSLVNRALAAADRGEGWQLPTNFDLAWWLYAFGGREALNGSPPPAFEEDLYMACTAVDGIQTSDLSRFLRYSPADEQWTELYSRQGFIWMGTLADPGALMLQEFDLATEAWQTNIWRDGERISAFAAPSGNFSLSFGETDPDGRRLVTYAFDVETDVVRAFLVDLEDCDEGCAASSLPGLPTWSPAGNWAIYTGDDLTFPDYAILETNGRYVLIDAGRGLQEFPLALGAGDAATNSNGLISIGEGRSPFWLDDQTLGFIHRSIPAGQGGQPGDDTIYLATVDDPTPEPLITIASLAQYLPDDNQSRRLTLGYVAAHPTQPRILIATLLDELE